MRRREENRRPTRGGGSRLRGVRYGEFDHITWVTMKPDGPVLANLMLDGIYPEDMRLPSSDAAPAPQRVPEKYAKPETSELRVTVKAGGNDFALELKK